jgi:hypothetical protein
MMLLQLELLPDLQGLLLLLLLLALLLLLLLLLQLSQDALFFLRYVQSSESVFG